jgi:Fe-S oxidoreductase
MFYPVQPALEQYLGIPGYLLMAFILTSGLALFSYSIYRRSLLLKSAGLDRRTDSLWRRFRDVAIYGIMQKRQARPILTGILHIFVFWGFVVLALRSILLCAIGLKADFALPFPAGPAGGAYNLSKDLADIIVFFACLTLALRRAVTTLIRHEPVHPKGSNLNAYLILGLINFLMVTDIAVEGSALLLGLENKYWLPAAHIVSWLLKGFSKDSIESIFLWNYWLHILSLIFFLNYLPFGKHFHIITALPNVFFRKLEKRFLKGSQWDLKKMEEPEPIGIRKIEDLTWKQILDLYTCTECGRCTAACPATAAGTPLSPMAMTLNMRNHSYNRRSVFPFGRKQIPDDPEYPLIGNAIDPDEIWSCTTCGACEEQCPVFIEYVDKIVEMRRELVLKQADFSMEIEKIFRNMETYEDPWGMGPAHRVEWVRDMGLEKMTLENNADLIYWVGCAGTFDHRAREAVGALIGILTASGISFEILGGEERCCGDFNRSTGNEYLFQVLAEKNIRVLKQRNAKKILTSCPHCYHILKNEYPRLGGNFEVLHHTEFIRDLIKAGKLAMPAEINKTFAFHDPCYLGRYNGIYDAPREILHRIPGSRTVKLKNSREKGFCCGAGGGRFWMAETGEKRINELRVEELLKAESDIIATACPYCLIMLEDGMQAKETTRVVRVMELSEIVQSALK